MCKLLFRAVALVFSGFAASALTAEPQARGASLQELAELAVLGSAELQASDALVREFAAAREQAQAPLNPELAFEVGTRRAAGGTWPADSGGRAASFTLTLSQPFYFPGKRTLRSDFAAAELRLAELARDEARLLIRSRAAVLAFAGAAADALAARAATRLQRFRLVDAYLQSRPFLSPTSRTERDMVRGRLRILETEQEALGMEKNALARRLQTYLGATPAPALRTVWAQANESVDCSALQARALERNPELLRSGLTVTALEAELRLAERNRYPDFALQATLARDGAPLREDYYAVGVQLSLPIFDANTHQVSRARERAAGARAIAEQRRREIERIAAATCDRFELASSAVRRFPIELDARTMNAMRETDAAFRSGRLELLAYIEADAQSFATLRAIYQSQLDYLESYIAVYSLGGEWRLPADFSNGTGE